MSKNYTVQEVAKSLGISRIAESGNLVVRWERVNEYLKVSPEVGKGDFIPEPAVYKLAFKANNEVAEKFQDWLATEVLPAINHTGGYVANAPKFIDNYFSNFSIDLRQQMIVELETNIKNLSIEKEKIDKQLLDSIKTIDEIRDSLK